MTSTSAVPAALASLPPNFSSRHEYHRAQLVALIPSHAVAGLGPVIDLASIALAQADRWKAAADVIQPVDFDRRTGTTVVHPIHAEYRKWLEAAVTALDLLGLRLTSDQQLRAIDTQESEDRP